MPAPALHARLSRRLCGLESSPIREVLAVLERPGMISFAGGLPAAQTFPRIDLGRLARGCLQYGPSEGDPALRRRVASDLRRLGLTCTAEQVLILSGSQQGIDLVAKLFIDPDTPVAVESPTYLAALQVFRFFGARLETIETPARWARAAPAERPAFAYVIPTFQNPSGRCYGTDERRALAASCDAASVPLFEDDPYRELAYEACERTPVCAYLRRASWVYQGSFSKSFAPGLRLGFLAASPDLLPLLVRLKQAADLHSSRLSQQLVLRHLESRSAAQRLDAIVAIYRRKRDRFARVLERELAALAEWRVPAGGLFFWLRLRTAIDTRNLLAPALERGVAFMPGEFFHPDRAQGTGTLRLNFSHATADQAERGLAALAELIGRGAA
jgi:2-aminoadipate transaminase